MTCYEENKYLNAKCAQVFLNAYVIPINFMHSSPPPQYLLTLQQNILLPFYLSQDHKGLLFS